MLLLDCSTPPLSVKNVRRVDFLLVVPQYVDIDVDVDVDVDGND